MKHILVLVLIGLFINLPTAEAQKADSLSAKKPSTLTAKVINQKSNQPDIEKTLKKLFGDKPLAKLSSNQADTLAAELANHECELGFKLRPFNPTTYKATWRDTVWVWGKFDIATPNGFSAKVTFRADGRNPKIDTFLSTDLRTMTIKEQPKEGLPNEK